MRYADVIVPLAVEGLFTYAVPDTLKDKVEAGTLVLAAFAGNRRYTALVVRVHGEKPEGYTVRMLEGVVEEGVKLSPVHVRFLQWVGDYYMATLGEVMKAALPAVFREPESELFREKNVAVIAWAREFTDEELGHWLDALKRAPAQYKLLCAWIEQGQAECEWKNGQ